MGRRALTLLLCTLLPAQAEEARKVFLDGIEMTLSKSADNNGLEIAYGADVPVNLRELGVTTGTLLVRGEWEENILIGEAWAFAPGCKPISYRIRGVVDYGGSLVIFGPVPTSCKADEFSWGKEAVIRFDLPPPAVTESKPGRSGKEKAKPKPAPKPKPKPKPKPRPTAVPQQPRQPQQYWPSYPQWWR